MGGKNGISDELLTQSLDSLSENDIGNTGEEGTGSSAGQSPGEGDTADGTEQEPGHDKEDQGKEDQKDISGPDQEQTSVNIEDGVLQLGIEEIRARLELMDKPADTELKTLTESLNSLVDLMSMDQYQQGGVYIPPDILIEGYTEWEYPITVEYLISVVGYEEMLPQSAEYDDPDQFLEDFQDMAWNCYLGTVFKDFYIDKVYDSGGIKVYDSQPETEPEPEPDPGEEEPKETIEQLLSHLESIDTVLAEMQQADLEYYQAVYDYQAEMLEINAAEAASTIFICFGIFVILAALLWSELFRRFK